MNILIRLPNWLGDMVMSTAFVKAVSEVYPGANIDLIAKKGIDILLDNFPPHGKHFIFSKDEYKGLRGAWRFGKKISKQNKYDFFFCLPDSFSSAAMGLASGAKKRVGFKKELRGVLLSDTFTKKNNLHRVEEYIDLLQQFTGKNIPANAVELKVPVHKKNNALLVNINSEANSRRLPKDKAVAIINYIRKNTPIDIILAGSNKEKVFVDEVYNNLADNSGINNMAGKTNLQELLELMASCKAVLTTDSGPAHLSNAAGTPTIVLFGAGNEYNTAPFNARGRSIIRLGQLPCEPCVSNECKVYGVPECLLRLDEKIILAKILESMQNDPA